jgi:cell filamentation protein
MKDYNLKDNYYCYKDSFVLKNKFDIKDKKILDSVEKDITGSILLLLQQRNFHKKELNYEFFIWLHKYIFGDIYNWAGDLRVVDLTKGDFKFAHYSYIDDQLKDYFLKLKKENYLIDYEYFKLIDKLTFFITELNVIHPFRDGNGRVIREYFRILLERKNLFIDYNDKEKYLEAMIESPYKMSKLKKFLNDNLKYIKY